MNFQYYCISTYYSEEIQQKRIGKIVEFVKNKGTSTISIQSKGRQRGETTERNKRVIVSILSCN